ncbi:hypothetical protein PoB_006170400, partial [Plakobranchus ocellatus]
MVVDVKERMKMMASTHYCIYIVRIVFSARRCHTRRRYKNKTLMDEHPTSVPVSVVDDLRDA